MRNITFIFIFIFAISLSFAESETLFEKYRKVSLPVLLNEIHPGQYLIGEPKIIVFAQELSNAIPNQLQEILSTKIVPYILGPNKRKWIIDRHHTLHTIHKMIPVFKNEGIEINDLFMITEKVLDLSHLSYEQFLNTMEELGYIHPYYFYGKKDLYNIPDSIENLKVDYFRGLAWLVRKSKAIKKSDVPFAEFTWAEYFYRSGLFQEKTLSIETIKRAIKISIRPSIQTMTLPGFRPNPKSLDHYMKNIKPILEIVNNNK